MHGRRSGRPPLLPSDVYHKLRSPKRFAHVSKHREALLPRVEGGGGSPTPTCRPLAAKMRSRRANASEALGMGAWRWCEFSGRGGKTFPFRQIFLRHRPIR